jgi:hypothetical protein
MPATSSSTTFSQSPTLAMIPGKRLMRARLSALAR